MSKIFLCISMVCGMLLLSACGTDKSDNTMPVPSAARGGVTPPGVTPQPMKHGHLAKADKEVAANAAVPAPAPAPVAGTPVAVAEQPAPPPPEPPVPVPVAVAPAVAAVPEDAPAPMPEPVPAVVAAPVAVSAESGAAEAAPAEVTAQMPAPPPSPSVASASVAVKRKHAPVKTPAVVADAEDKAGLVDVSVPGGAPSGNSPNGGYVLGTGDEIRLTVYGEDDLSGQYQIGSTGIVSLPLVGNVVAAGRTIDQFEAAVGAKLSKGYLKDPRVSVQVANYRPFFILGEVAKPGSYPYVNGMTVMSAVATAGGYTYRADHDDVRVMHANVPNAEEQDIAENASIMPGDIIRVTERFF